MYIKKHTFQSVNKLTFFIGKMYTSDLINVTRIY